MSKTTNGNKRTTRAMKPDQKAKIAASMKGKQHSPETRAKISAAMKSYWASIPYADGHPINDPHPVNEPSDLFDGENNNNSSKTKQS